MLLILVKDCNPKKLKVGDDIVYIGNKHDLKDKIISHRIVEIKKDDKTGELKFITKGVANDIPDPAITSDQILGKVDMVLPIITPINHIIKSQAGFFVLVFCPLVIVIVLEILHVISEIGDDKQKIDRIGQTTIAMERIMEEEKKEEDEEEAPPVIERVSDNDKEEKDEEDVEEDKKEDYDDTEVLDLNEREKEEDKENNSEDKFIISNEE